MRTVLVALMVVTGCKEDPVGSDDTEVGTSAEVDTTEGTEGTELGTDADTDTDVDSDTGVLDITNVLLTQRFPDCEAYVRAYEATATDLRTSTVFDATLDVSVQGAGCRFETNSIPNHDMQMPPANFANAIAAVDASYLVPAEPVAQAEPTALTLRYNNAVFLNGVKLDVLAAACYGVGNAPLGEERIGCGNPNQPWRYDPMFPGNTFGTDNHNAHTQPDGQYHYHGSPNALFDGADMTRESPVIGFAADGFPIFGPVIDDDGTFRHVRSGYTLRQGDRVSLDGEGAFPGGQYDGTFRDDFEWTNAGDLDECNGMVRDGVYGYYVTDTYPWVMACFRGTPDESFEKPGPGGPARIPFTGRF